MEDRVTTVSKKITFTSTAAKIFSHLCPICLVSICAVFLARIEGWISRPDLWDFTYSASPFALLFGAGTFAERRAIVNGDEGSITIVSGRRPLNSTRRYENSEIAFVRLSSFRTANSTWQALDAVGSTGRIIRLGLFKMRPWAEEQGRSVCGLLGKQLEIQ